ncbi:MAG: hypothetical protein PHH04_07270 [Thomasclavelia sp.]|nr:hypothetical protein [Thomasclavelia sp.]
MKEKFKKFWKEISVFGLVFVVFIALYAYRQYAFPEYTTISASKCVEKIKDKDDFVVVVGSDKDNTTVDYQTVMQKFIEKHRGSKLYYCNISSKKDQPAWVQKTFNTENGTIPQTFVVKNGKVKVSKAGSLSFSRLVDLYDKLD